MQNLGCDPLRALAPITLAAVQPFVVAASNNVPAKSIAELVALAKAKPNSLSYGSGGVRAASHLGVVLLEQKGGFELLHVAYKGSNPAITAVMAHEIQLTLAGLSTVLPHAKAGKLRGHSRSERLSSRAGQADNAPSRSPALICRRSRP